MTDDPLSHAFGSLDPDHDAEQRMQHGALAAYDVTQTPLAAEWVALSRAHPIVSAASMAVAAAAVVFATPVGAILWVLTRWA